MTTINKNHRFDVYFDNDDSSNNKGFSESYDYCMDYIEINNGANDSYFEDYKGGMVSIYDIDAGEYVYSEQVK